MFIILMSLLNIQFSHAQSTTGAPAAPVARSLEFKKDDQGRPFFTDKDQDKIIILDHATRKEFKALSNIKNVNSVNPEVDPKSFYKEKVDLKLMETAKPVYKIYTIEEGDTWESISEKIYGVSTLAAQLKVWNEELLVDINLPSGAKVKYLEREKK